ncbi:asparagine synthase-related protein [Halosimplex halophilum]|uniref:asparagine synthase-related protein n=1 Tax=Halosimplex halophilum TaxID=2559572 RepID=UPI00107EEDEA|nr:asparagine synthase-related protein [Halosimplex halophilum]
MVGLSGVVGEGADAAVETVAPTVDDERASTYRDGGIAVRSAFHEGAAVDQPVETADGALVWTWGEVVAVTDDGGERRRVDPTESARVCAEQYADHGTGFADRLDGEFVGLVYDPDAELATFFVDRVGARPLYYARGDGTLAFSTSIQTVPSVPGHEPSFAGEYLAEYLYARRTQGTKTPVDGIEQIAPATLLSYDAGGDRLDDRQYWRPRYDPVDEPLSYFVRELAERFEAAVADRMPRDGDYGLLLSGGSDSRTVLAAADDPPDCYHMGDGWNREARYAKEAADAAGARFERLDRGLDYHETLLERAAPIQEFLGPFQSGHMLGYADTLAGHDALFTGLYSDVLFGSWSVPQLELSLPFGVTLWPPVADVPETPEDHAAWLAARGMARDPAFVDAPPYEEILTANLAERGGYVEDHGVPCESVGALSLGTYLFPVTNGIGFDMFASAQIAPTRTPLLDRRLIDLHLSMPLKYRLRADPLQRALKRLDPSLAGVRHASSNVPVGAHRAAHLVGDRVTNQIDKVRGPDSFRTEGPLQDKNEVIRESDFLGRALERNEARGRALPCVDWPRVEETYRRHQAGETDAAEELYRLVTVLESPVAGRILDP